MFGLSAFDLARIQFAFTVSFHIIFPAITIGLASFLAVLEGLWLKTRNKDYLALFHFWSKIFAVNFAMGVVSGLVMAYQFGTNWSFFSDFAGSITGPLLTYEVLTAFIQALIGDMHGLNTLKHQPAKIAAIEGHWQNNPGEATPLILFGIPDMNEEKTKYALQIPYLGSLILTHSLDKQVPALKEFPKDDRPNSLIVFWSFRIMVGLGMLMILVGVWGTWLRYKKKLYQSNLFLRFTFLMAPSGLIAILAGWFTTEVGRQPWVVYGIQRTRDAVSAHGEMHMSISLLIFFIVYGSVFGIGYAYMLKLIRKGAPEVQDGN
ncbi:TPA: cytochrome ubiquinol oxidase subunit I [Proteus mirabilis]|nr:cytochrome ubiquinol oxidase subunit I [Proteus mirabilis]HEK1207337.1 cytochrome ubiquinol oxidase subunit I [Proteus mirabilis]HEK3144489.1 cytochrome ubiquinol oxidase subunit I [Proteus mirabilis]